MDFPSRMPIHLASFERLFPYKRKYNKNLPTLNLGNKKIKCPLHIVKIEKILWHCCIVGGYKFLNFNSVKLKQIYLDESV